MIFARIWKVPLDRKFTHTLLRQQFGNQGLIAKATLIDFLSMHFGKAKPSTLAWRLHELTQEGVLIRVGYGQYQLNDRPIYRPMLSPTLCTISERIKTEFPLVECCVWDSRLLASLMVQQPMRYLHIVEVDRDAVSSVYYQLQAQPVLIERKSPAIYFYEDWLLLSRHGTPLIAPVIIKPLISEAPLQVVQDRYVTAPIEKILVDLMADKDLFFAYQEEVDYIAQTAFAKFTINRDKLRRYARRRNRVERVNQLLTSIDQNG